MLERLEEIQKKLQEEETRALQNDREADVDQVMDKFPPVEDVGASPSMDSLSFLDSLPSVPKHMPSNTTTPTAKSISPQMPPPPPPASDPPPTYMKMPEPRPSAPPPIPAHNSIVQIPPPTNFNFPNSVIVDPLQLATWLVKKKDRQQPNILLVDVRPREVYDQGCIKHSWTVQIEPLILKQK